MSPVGLSRNADRPSLPLKTPWKVLVEAPSNDPDTFLSTIRLNSLDALRIRLGDVLSVEARHRQSILIFLQL
jgi:hypothetical protein